MRILCILLTIVLLVSCGPGKTNRRNQSDEKVPITISFDAVALAGGDLDDIFAEFYKENLT